MIGELKKQARASIRAGDNPDAVVAWFETVAPDAGVPPFVIDHHLAELRQFANEWTRDHSAQEAPHSLNGKRPATHTDPAPVVEEAWEDALPLPDTQAQVDRFNYDLLPAPLRPWIRDIAQRMEQPPDIAAVGAVVTLSALIGRKCGIYPKRQDDWLVVPNLWGLCVALPSRFKTPMLEEVTRPLERLAADAEAVYQDAMREYAVQRELYEARVAGRKDALRKAAKDAALGKAPADALDTVVADTLVAPEPPTSQRHKTNDATVEKIGQLLIENPNCLLVYRDEMAGLLYSLEKIGREGDRQFYLESWSGRRSYHVDRIGRGELHIPALCLSLLGGIQPGPLSAYVAAAHGEDQDNDGFLQRFQLTVWPDPPTVYHGVDRYPDAEAKNAAYAVFVALAAFDPVAWGVTCEDDEEIPALRFDQEAQVVFNTWRTGLENRLLAGDLHEALEAHLAKYRSLMPSLALIFHLAEYVTSECATMPSATRHSAEQAIAWCAYLESHAHRLYDSAVHPGVARAGELLAHLQRGDSTDGTSVRDLWRKHWSGLDTPESVEAALKLLADYGWVRFEDRKPATGRPTKVVRLHPDLRASATEEQ
jgi:predicted transcriptional regulator